MIDTMSLIIFTDTNIGLPYQGSSETDDSKPVMPHRLTALTIASWHV
jgi:hypothetical protein